MICCWCSNCLSPLSSFLLIVFWSVFVLKHLKVNSGLDWLIKSSSSCWQALEKSKYEQSLESVRRFIAIAEKELELYYRHIALYGDPNDRNPMSILDGPSKNEESGKLEKKSLDSTSGCFQAGLSDPEANSPEASESEDNFEEDFSISESDSEDDGVFVSNFEERELRSSLLEESSSTQLDLKAWKFEDKSLILFPIFLRKLRHSWLDKPVSNFGCTEVRGTLLNELSELSFHLLLSVVTLNL